MKRQNYEIDLPFYTALLQACGEAGNPDRAEEYLQEMSKAGVEGDRACYNAQILACGKTGELRRAEA